MRARAGSEARGRVVQARPTCKGRQQQQQQPGRRPPPVGSQGQGHWSEGRAAQPVRGPTDFPLGAALGLDLEPTRKAERHGVRGPQHACLSPTVSAKGPGRATHQLQLPSQGAVMGAPSAPRAASHAVANSDGRNLGTCLAGQNRCVPGGWAWHRLGSSHHPHGLGQLMGAREGGRRGLG